MAYIVATAEMPLNGCKEALMLLIITLAIVGIAAIEVTDDVFSDGADIRQRRAIECAVAMMAAVVCIGMAWW